MRRIALLGATGSVGRSTLEVLRAHPGAFRLAAVAAGRNADALADVIVEFEPELAALAEGSAATARLQDACSAAGTSLVLGADAPIRAAEHPTEVVVAAIVGAAGLPATVAAVGRGAVVALANKESLVVAGEALTLAAERSGACLLPVDSEHAAIHQCLRAGAPGEVRRLILTASGGPFRDRPAASLESVSVDEALRHPTWKMGAKISIDSATLMNKGLELIEARWLFGFPASCLDVVIHPQSIVHSLVEYRDGSVIAQLNRPDMKDPIRYCLTHPERWEVATAGLDLASVSPLTFERPEAAKFPCLGLARAALAAGGAAPAILNAANEVAVAAFLSGRLRFPGIPRLIEDVLAREGTGLAGTLEEALAADARGRRVAEEMLARTSRSAR